jgi:hypothetical protein
VSIFKVDSYDLFGGSYSGLGDADPVASQGGASPISCPNGSQAKYDPSTGEWRCKSLVGSLGTGRSPDGTVAFDKDAERIQILLALYNVRVQPNPLGDFGVASFSDVDGVWGSRSQAAWDAYRFGVDPPSPTDRDALAGLLEDLRSQPELSDQSKWNETRAKLRAAAPIALPKPGGQQQPPAPKVPVVRPVASKKTTSNQAAIFAMSGGAVLVGLALVLLAKRK